MSWPPAVLEGTGRRKSKNNDSEAKSIKATRGNKGEMVSHEALEVGRCQHMKDSVDYDKEFRSFQQVGSNDMTWCSIFKRPLWPL